jgi:sterol desaturase/sphingolipid hydroxylase (fatty acid hydroxylase superfamily)
MTLPNLVELAVPGFVLLIVLELVGSRILHRGDYESGDAAASLLMGFGNTIQSLLTGGLVYGAMTLVYRVRLLDLPWAWWVWGLLYFGEDFAYYWFHRLSHERRVWWASHVNHHSSQHYNLTTALRQTWTGPLTLTWIVWLPLPLLGFPPEMVLFQQGISLLYQFWIHTELIDRMPAWFEAAFNTPSHHRVHHATNPRYLDSNYAGILIIWDRLFGTFVAERTDDPCRYGIVRNLGSFNPLKVAFHEWRAILRDLEGSHTRRERLGYLFGPPGWRPDGFGRTSAAIRAEWRARTGAVTPSAGDAR